MSNLRKEVIKLANRKPELRNVLLPLLKKAGPRVFLDYPSQDDAKFVSQIVAFYDNIGMGLTLTPEYNYLKKDLWNSSSELPKKTFGPDSPWTLNTGKVIRGNPSENPYFEFLWDKGKAERLGIELPGHLAKEWGAL